MFCCYKGVVYNMRWGQGVSQHGWPCRRRPHANTQPERKNAAAHAAALSDQLPPLAARHCCSEVGACEGILRTIHERRVPLNGHTNLFK